MRKVRGMRARGRWGLGQQVKVKMGDNKRFKGEEAKGICRWARQVVKGKGVSD